MSMNCQRWTNAHKPRWNKRIRLRTLVLTLASVALTLPAHAFDRVTIAATRACHDYVWFQVPEFKDLPNAAISAFPGRVDGKTHTINWNVNWDDPKVRAAGNCTVINNKVEGFEDYTKMNK